MSAALTPGSLDVVAALIVNAISSGLNETALFIAERLAHASQHANEGSTYLLALAHWRTGDPRAAVEVLRRRIILHNEAIQPLDQLPKRIVPRSRPAHELSARCAFVYASCCGELGRPREGEEVLAKAISEHGAADVVLPTCVAPSAAALFVRLGKLALQSGQLDKAAAYFRDAMLDRWWCWEAYEALCTLNEASEPDVVFGSTSQPPPIATQRSNGIGVSSGGFFTPGFGSSYPPPVPNSVGDFRHRANSVGFDETSSSLDPSFFSSSMRRVPSQPVPVFPLAGSSTLLTPDFAAARPTSGLPAPQKRARPGDVLEVSVAPDPAPPPAPPAARTRARTATTQGSKPSRQPSAPPSISGESSASGNAPRRSTRLSSKETPAANGVPPALNGGPRQRTVSGNPRDRKRAKATSDDATMTTISNPRSSSSPELMSALAGLSPHASAHDELLAEDWLRDALRRFGRAYWALGRFECSEAVDATLSMPEDMRTSWRALMIRARAKFELLEYAEAERSFCLARDAAPYLLEGTELHSTVLWHLNRPTALAVLSQQLMHLHPTSAQAWIASGNVFSQLEDHPAALKCFQRAAQANPNMAYAYTLAGHECVALEEWERALGFFREAIGKDKRHYNAWFGLGNAYMKTSRLRLADFHFREAVRINPHNAMLVCCVGTVLDKLGDRQGALEMFERAVTLAPNSAAVRFKHVRALVAAKEYASALGELEVLKSTAQNEHNVHFMLGRLYGHLGDRVAMVTHLTFAQELDPRSASRIREALEAFPDPNEASQMQE